MKHRSLPALAVVALLTLSACNGDDSANSDTSTATADQSADQSAAAPSSDDPTVTLTDSTFDQTELRVSAGTTVTFMNTDSFAHTVTSDDGSPIEFDSGEFGEGETFEFTFDEPGEYPYFCQIHPTMQATIIVE